MRFCWEIVSVLGECGFMAVNPFGSCLSPTVLCLTLVTFLLPAGTSGETKPEIYSLITLPIPVCIMCLFYEYYPYKLHINKGYR